MLPLDLISTRSIVDKLHCAVINADLAWSTSYGQDKINMIRVNIFEGMEINNTFGIINTALWAPGRECKVDGAAVPRKEMGPPAVIDPTRLLIAGKKNVS